MNRIKALFIAGVVLIAGCNAAQQIAQNPGQAAQEIAQFGPPYTFAKMQTACAGTDAISKDACAKFGLVAAACMGDIGAQAQVVNLGIGVFAMVNPAAGNAALAANKVAVVVLTQAQAMFCADGGFPTQAMEVPSAMPTGAAVK